MNRRGFLSLLAGSAVLDPERLLWVPGAKVYSLPLPGAKVYSLPLRGILEVGDIITIAVVRYRVFYTYDAASDLFQTHFRVPLLIVPPCSL